MDTKMIKKIRRILDAYDRKEISEKEGMERIQACLDVFTYGLPTNNNQQKN